MESDPVNLESQQGLVKLNNQTLWTPQISLESKELNALKGN